MPVSRFIGRENSKEEATVGQTDPALDNTVLLTRGTSYLVCKIFTKKNQHKKHVKNLLKKLDFSSQSFKNLN